MSTPAFRCPCAYISNKDRYRLCLPLSQWHLFFFFFLCCLIQISHSSFPLTPGGSRSTVPATGLSTLKAYVNTRLRLIHLQNPSIMFQSIRSWAVTYKTKYSLYFFYCIQYFWSYFFPGTGCRLMKFNKTTSPQGRCCVPISKEQYSEFSFGLFNPFLISTFSLQRIDRGHFRKSTSHIFFSLTRLFDSKCSTQPEDKINSSGLFYLGKRSSELKLQHVAVNKPQPKKEKNICVCFCARLQLQECLRAFLQ